MFSKISIFLHSNVNARSSDTRIFTLTLCYCKSYKSLNVIDQYCSLKMKNQPLQHGSKRCSCWYHGWSMGSFWHRYTWWLYDEYRLRRRVYGVWSYRLHPERLHNECNYYVHKDSKCHREHARYDISKCNIRYGWILCALSVFMVLSLRGWLGCERSDGYTYFELRKYPCCQDYESHICLRRKRIFVRHALEYRTPLSWISTLEHDTVTLMLGCFKMPFIWTLRGTAGILHRVKSQRICSADLKLLLIVARIHRVFVVSEMETVKNTLLLVRRWVRRGVRILHLLRIRHLKPYLPIKLSGSSNPTRVSVLWLMLLFWQLSCILQ